MKCSLKPLKFVLTKMGNSCKEIIILTVNVTLKKKTNKNIPCCMPAINLGSNYKTLCSDIPLKFSV